MKTHIKGKVISNKEQNNLKKEFYIASIQFAASYFLFKGITEVRPWIICFTDINPFFKLQVADQNEAPNFLSIFEA